VRQLVHIHGGKVFDTYEEYWEYLERHVIDDPVPEKSVKWKDRYEEFLGSGWTVIRPQMPGGLNNKYKEWELWFKKYTPFLEDNLVLVGHSLGANFLAKYLAEHTLRVKVAQLHLVAGCFGWKADFDLPEDLSNIEAHIAQVFIYHSRDDEQVPFEHAEKFKEALPLAEFVEFQDRGHFILPEFPELTERIEEENS